MPRKVVLCIDDRTTNAEVRKLLLECEGYQVRMASNGRSGLSTFATHTIDLVVLDYDLPDMNGAVVAANMRDIKPSIPIIMLSPRTLPPAGVRHLVDAYITKGENPAVFLDCVSELLTQS